MSLTSPSFSAMYDESERGKRVWMQEFFNIGKFSNAYQREANILHDALRFVLNVDAIKHEYPDIYQRLRAELNKAVTVRLDAVKPLPARLHIESVEEAFAIIAESEGMDITRSGDKFTHPLTKRFESMFILGAIMGFNRCQQGIDEVAAPEPAPVNYVKLMEEIPAPVVKRRVLLEDDEPPKPLPRRTLLDE